MAYTLGGPTITQTITGARPLQQFMSQFSTYLGRTIQSSWGLVTSMGTAAAPPVAGTPPNQYTGFQLNGPVAGQIPVAQPEIFADAYLMVNRFATGVFSAARNNVSSNRIIFTPMLVDRLWWSNRLPTNTTSATTINSVPWPARDVNESSDGEGVYIAMANAPGTPTGSNYTQATISYTNSAGIAGRTGTSMAFTNAPTYLMDGIHMFSLQDGDTGVQSVQTFTLGGTLAFSPQFYLFAFRPICMLDMKNAGGEMSIDDAISLAAPQVYENSVIQILYFPADILPAGTSFTNPESLSYGGPMEVQFATCGFTPT